MMRTEIQFIDQEIRPKFTASIRVEKDAGTQGI